MRRGRLFNLLITALVSAVTVATGAMPASAASIPTATNFGGMKTVGALFPAGSNTHTCTASVMHSATANLIVTAAHCLHGTGAGMVFIPGYANGKAPYGRWVVTKAWAPYTWRTSQNPAYDYAILQVASQVRTGKRVGIQQVTGGYSIALTRPYGTSITVPAYNAGSGDLPVRCTNKMGLTRGYPTLMCNRYYGGVSGAPFLANVGGVTYNAGVLGGLHQGGCYSYVSYASPITKAFDQVYYRAIANGASDRLPVPGGDGC